MKKKVHLAKMVREGGDISPQCAIKYPWAIDLSRETWTLQIREVTCKKCMIEIMTMAVDGKL